ncbi:MAG TPA: hemerythrin domain-containing protein [bacterium]|nr:hemerythrin domain-containing protein [bacterium]
MKREKFLWPLTQSHHRALLMARWVREKLSASGAVNEGAVKEMAEEALKLYEEELKLHFWDEEKILVLYEERMGKEEPEPQRIRKEHRLLESMLFRADRESLLAFAELLNSHVRFEEDVLFGRIEKILDEVGKQAVEHLLEREAALNGPRPGNMEYRP